MITIETDNFLNIEKKQLFKKLTIYIGNKIEIATDYKKIEIAKHIGTSTSRISEWKNYDHYQQLISNNDLIKCIACEIVTVKELVDKCVETEKEKEFLNNV